MPAAFHQVEEARENHDLETLIWPCTKPDNLGTHLVVVNHEIYYPNLLDIFRCMLRYMCPISSVKKSLETIKSVLTKEQCNG